MISRSAGILLLAILLFTLPVFSQQHTRSVSGMILDKESGTGLAGVSVTDTRYGYGTLSNKDGKFTLHLPQATGPDSLQFSMMGYQTATIFLGKKSTELPLRIDLGLASTTLSEVVITEENPVDIIKAAIRKIPDNYISEGHIQQGFYRTATKKGPEYIQLSEAVFDIYHYGYGKNKKGQLKLEKMRALKDEKGSHGIDLGMRPNGIFAFDMINHAKDHPVIGEDGQKKHRFVLRGLVPYEGAEAYEISFDQKPDQKEALYKGRIYILKEQLVIVAIHYDLSPKGIRYARYGDWAIRALLKLLDLSIRIKKDETQVKYRRMGTKWVLSDVKNNTVLQLSSKRKQFDFLADVAVDFVNTGIDTASKEPFAGDQVLGNNQFIEHQDAGTDTAFWNDHNILLEDFPVSAVVRKIKTANETFNLKKSTGRYLDKLPRKNLAKIDSLISFYHRGGQFNGTALVVHHGEIVLDKSYGLADRDKHTVADKNTRYRIGSLSKTFTALVIQQLAREGKLDISATVGTYLPDYSHPEITLSQLLSHTSGLPNCSNNPAYLSGLMTRPLSSGDRIKQFCSDPPEFKSGTSFAYSNSGYMLLAYIAEIIEQKDFARILKERIFGPLHMEDTYLGWDAQAPRTATGYLYDQEEPVYSVTNFAGAGGITSTAHDLLLWNKSLLKESLLPAKAQEELYTPRAAYADWGADYGYGWMIDKLQFSVSAKSRIIYHPGTDLGFYTMFVKKDDTESLVILLSNTGDFPRFDMTDLILSTLPED